MKNYLLNALMAGGIVIGLSLGGAALGIALKNDKKTIATMEDVNSGVLPFIGGFKDALSVAENKLFLAHFGFDEASAKKTYVAQTSTDVKYEQVLEDDVFSNDLITTLLKKSNAFGVTKVALKKTKFIFSLKVKINLDNTETVLFNDDKTVTFEIIMAQNAGKSEYSIVVTDAAKFKFSDAAADDLAALIGDFVTSENKENFFVYYAKTGGLAASKGTDLEYAFALNKKTGALYYTTKAATKAINAEMLAYIEPTGTLT